MKPRWRPQTPREALARDHNWLMGRFRRLLTASSMFSNPSRKRQFEILIEEEMRIRQEIYLEEKEKLK